MSARRQASRTVAMLTHVREKRDVFVTDDEALLVVCRRLRDEHDVAIKAASLSEYLSKHVRA